MRSRGLLVTFDAWQTLFTPREPVATQYARVARDHGVDVEESEIELGFRRAFKEYYKKYPNYGKTAGMSSQQWWEKVVADSFAPTTIPPALAPALVAHFATKEAYILHTSIPFLLQSLRANTTYDKTVIGVVSNSDCRVLPILSSLGILVRNDPQDQRVGINGTLDFVTLSYDVGVEKPHQRIFEAAFNTARRQDDDTEREWTRVHVGDDVEKDVKAAESAGWRAVLWDGEGEPEDILRKILGGP
ncbi:HAD-like domain-containing protein [Sphaerosporella brunnea]|uniref:HAD-like domain-containing protein n=1 Tax=Sphaerosporella brunnea TaxID=1250544 RepID=A0A5J5ET49_9PEZI|nr:HAD-like domain-containing protein [Sphaerosporella brunnea]